MNIFTWFKKQKGIISEPIELIKSDEEEFKKFEDWDSNDMSYEEMMMRFSQIFLMYHRDFNEGFNGKNKRIMTIGYDLKSYEWESYINIYQFQKSEITIKLESNNFSFITPPQMKNSECFDAVEKFFAEHYKETNFTKTFKHKLVDCGILSVEHDYFSKDQHKIKFKISDCGNLIVRYNTVMNEFVVFEKKYNKKFEFHCVETKAKDWYTTEKEFDELNCGGHWKHIEINSINDYWLEECLNSDVVKRYDREQQMVVHITDVFEKHKRYISVATKHDLIVPVPIQNFDSYLSFCNSLNIQTEFKNWEIENYLRSIGKYCPNK